MPNKINSKIFSDGVSCTSLDAYPRNTSTDITKNNLLACVNTYGLTKSGVGGMKNYKSEQPPVVGSKSPIVSTAGDHSTSLNAGSTLGNY